MSPPARAGARGPVRTGRILAAAGTCLALALILVAGPVRAEDDRGAVCAASPACRAPAPKPSPSALPTLQFSGYVQLQANDGSLGSLQRAPARPALTGVGLYPTDTRIVVRRLRPRVDWNLSRNLHLRTEGQYDSISRMISLKDLSLRWEATPWMALTAGQMSTRWGSEGLRSSAALEVIERSDVTAAIYQGRDVGIDVELRRGPLRCNLGVYNGERLKLTSVKPRTAMARVLWQASRDWAAGASVQYGRQENGALAPLPVRRFGLELHYSRAPWLVEGEYLWSHGFNFSSRANTVGNGWYVRATRRVGPHLDVVAGFDTVDPALARVTTQGAGNTLNSRYRVLWGVNVYPDGARKHRVALDYEIHRMSEGTPRTRQGWRAQYQVRW